ncbi:uncharacterized protein MELLADRAFT_102913 [Melampsora larici-populina 98AG31]|uniref:Uncharacterized protein n=1 Tax=Melampsora larici-populina (strain 98AG31 / pathotype 3-4-7) TaxID=747676 RepID=F4R8K6_MELLP|nr:uncharacterized protein MELLADRAFT_102913 [Melampsora larici-populina 98AG31]EGG11096.1 hypothetical protein MELLADRAFT_102913 [Melampsora larici-populina 98AG31]
MTNLYPKNEAPMKVVAGRGDCYTSSEVLIQLEIVLYLPFVPKLEEKPSLTQTATIPIVDESSNIILDRLADAIKAENMDTVKSLKDKLMVALEKEEKVKEEKKKERKKKKEEKSEKAKGKEKMKEKSQKKRKIDKKDVPSSSLSDSDSSSSDSSSSKSAAEKARKDSSLSSSGGSSSSSSPSSKNNPSGSSSSSDSDLGLKFKRTKASAFNLPNLPEKWQKAFYKKMNRYVPLLVFKHSFIEAHHAASAFGSKKSKGPWFEASEV